MTTDTLIDLSEAAKRIPGRPHAATVWRWARKGVLSRSGERIKLSHRRVGARIFIDPADLDRFFTRVAEADAAHFDRAEPIPLPQPAPSRGGQRRHAESTLRKAGILA